MDVEEIIKELHHNQKVIVALLQGAPEDFIKWKPNPKGWCALEIICHLIDEEVEDFRARVRHALENPEAPLVPIDPQGWAITRNYLEQDFESSVERWQLERQNSIAWLKGLINPKWENAIDHPERGKITARSFLCNWLAHDYHHIRQINNLKYNYHKENSGDPLTYAGKW